MRKTRLTSPAVLSLAVLLLASALVWVGCSGDLSTSGTPAESLAKLQPNLPADLAQVMAVQDAHTGSLMSIDGVVGTGTGLNEDGNLVVKVFTARAGVSGIPSSLDNVPVEIMHTGPFTAHNGILTERYRPVPIGVSVGNNLECACGTIGCVVEKDGQKYILSNNHVLARSNAASIGEDIVQPGRYDNKRCENRVATDKVGELADFEPIAFDGANNYFDAAIAVYTTADVTCATLPEFYGLPGTTVVDAYVGMSVKKVGRTTALTVGTVDAINVTSSIGYSTGSAIFVNQIMTTKGFDKSGDSGSMVVTNDANNNPVALLFAGTGSGIAIVSPIAPVFERFGVTICGN
ncbi:MAG TPA: hypothetical protein VM118_07495 [Acidobacteriota bacterium]|nr:hypothetical protein [Acidobacteriota bacterium]